MNNLGYDKALFILPFDHRSTFEKQGFSKEEIASSKEIIYEGFKKALLNGVPKDLAAILVDEEFGDRILKDAKEKGFTILLTSERSGGEEFEFQYEDFEDHIKKYEPAFVKALIKVKIGQTAYGEEKIKKLSVFCHDNGYKFLLEVVSGGDKNLILETIRNIQNFGIDVDVWKLEGMEAESDYQELVNQAQIDGRENVKVVILGRGENAEKVDHWVKTGAKVNGIIGFAIGRTIFWESVAAVKNGEKTWEEAVSEIAKNFEYYYNLFINSKI